MMKTGGSRVDWSITAEEGSLDFNNMRKLVTDDSMTTQILCKCGKRSTFA
jgi:hypothetical protein